MRRLFVVPALTLAIALAACERPAPDTPTSQPGDAAATPVPARRTWWFQEEKPPPAPTPPQPPAKIWEEFSGEKAFLHVRDLVQMGPRPSGSETLERAREYITKHVEAAGWEVTRQEFDAQTPRGTVRFVNLIARFRAGVVEKPAPDALQKIIVASHYDTKLFDTIEFVGAHDGASSTGALIELARVLAMDWSMAKQIELVFFDGEEAVQQFSETDGLYGSRYYSRILRETRRFRQFKSGVLWDMIGDRDLTITLSPDTPALLAKAIFVTAERFGLRQHFRYHDRPILDDHVPLIQSGVPTINLIDFDYIYWHTADDTLDKLAPESLTIVGKVTLYYLWTQLGLVVEDHGAK